MRGVQASRCDVSRGFAASAETNTKGEDLCMKCFWTAVLPQQSVIATFSLLCRHATQARKSEEEESLRRRQNWSKKQTLQHS